MTTLTNVEAAKIFQIGADPDERPDCAALLASFATCAQEAPAFAISVKVMSRPLATER